MKFFEVWVADGRYRGDKPLTYSYAEKLAPFTVVTVDLRGRAITGFIYQEVKKPEFAAKPIKAVMSQTPLPWQCFELARWLSDYYSCSLGDSLRQFAPSKPTIRRGSDGHELAETGPLQLELDKPLTSDQKKALNFIRKSKHVTTLLHGDTGTGKTRVYLELAQETLNAGQSVILLTPEIALTTQLAAAVDQQLPSPAYILHSQLTAAARKKIWLAILEATEPVVVIGPRSALFSPVKDLGLIVLDEAHEPAYKQEQTPRYNAVRVASQLGTLTKAKVVLGTATPNVADYYLAERRKAIVRMTQPAMGDKHTDVKSQVIDLKDRTNFRQNPYLSDSLIEAAKKTLAAKKQVIIYLNRRGSARQILCQNCGWQALCPNCDLPLIYHGDEHLIRCHTCGFTDKPPAACPVCGSLDIIYRSIGTKALVEAVAKVFPEYRIQRFDSDNDVGERVHELYSKLKSGEIDILVGTQLLAKGFDLPHLGLVGIISADSSMGLPDFTAEERSFQLLYQIIGRVGRGHGQGQVIVQTYDTKSAILLAALARDWSNFYKNALAERQTFRFPPFAYLLKLVVRRATANGAQNASENVKKLLRRSALAVEIIGPTPSFYGRRGKYFYWQLVVKSKQREHLTKLAREVPADWTVDLDPANLL